MPIIPPQDNAQIARKQLNVPVLLTQKEIASGYKRLDEYESKRSDVVTLAMLASLARRIEPELLRALRLAVSDRFAADHFLSVATEAALWFSPLIESRGPDNITLLPGVSQLLRERLRADQKLLHLTYSVIKKCHHLAPPVIHWEEELIYWSLNETSPESERKENLEKNIISAIKAVYGGDRPELEEWIIGAGVRLPESVNRNPLVAELRSISEAGIIDRNSISSALGDHKHHDRLNFSGIPKVLIDVLIIGDVFRIGYLSGTGQFRIRVPDLQPITIDILSSDDTYGINSLVIMYGESVDVLSQTEHIKLRTIDGQIYTIFSKQVLDKCKRARALAEIATRLPDSQKAEVLGEALAVAQEIEDKEARARALAKIAPNLPDIQDAFAIARDIENKFRQAKALSGIATRLPDSQKDEVLKEALTAARKIEDKGERAEALTEITSKLSNPQTAFVVSREIKDKEKRAKALAEIATRLPDSQKAEIFREALVTARSINDKGVRAKALAEIATRLPDSQKAEVFREALVMTQEINDKGERAKALVAISTRLPNSQKAEALKDALAAAQEIEDKETRAKALAKIAPNLPDIQDASVIAREIENKFERAKALAVIAAKLPEHQKTDILREALTVVQQYEDVKTKVPIQRSSTLMPNRILRGHSGQVRKIATAPDGKQVISCSYDNTLRIWDLRTGTSTKTFLGHTDRVFGAIFTPNNKYAISCSADKTIRKWNLKSGVCDLVFIGHSKGVYCVAVTPDGKRVISGSFDKTVRIWDLESGRCNAILEGHTDSVFGVIVTKNGRYAVSSSGDKTLRIWDLKTEQCIATLKGHSESVDCIALSPDGELILSGSRDHTIRIWALESGKNLAVMEGHSDAIYDIAVTSDQRWALTSSVDKTVRIWNLSKRTCVNSIKLSSYLTSLAITPKNFQVIFGCEDNSIWVWDLLPYMRNNPIDLDQNKTYNATSSTKAQFSKYQALLIGIPEYISKAIPPLPFIKSDMKGLHNALESIGYEVQSIGFDNAPQASLTNIRRLVNEFCSNAKNDKTLILYLSGHGIHFGNNDYLVPCDASIDDLNIEKYLIPLSEFDKIFQSSRAETILFFIDAFPEKVNEFQPLKGSLTKRFQHLKDREIAYIFSCRRDEVSQFITESKPSSLFSRALIETIEDSYAETFKEVTDEIQTRLRKLTNETNKPSQEIEIYLESLQDDRLFNRSIFDRNVRDNEMAWYSKGLALCEQGKYDEAINAYNKAIEINPQNAEVWNGKGIAFDHLMKYNYAIEAYDEAIRLIPNFAIAWSNKGNTLSHQGKYRKAIKAYNEAIRLDPKFAMAWRNKGWDLGNLSQYDEAIKAYDQAIKLDPSDPISWANKGWNLGNLGKYNEAIEACDKAIRLDPKYAVPWCNKGWSLNNQGKYDEAIKACDEAIKRNPKYAKTFKAKGNILNDRGKHDEAIKAYNEAIRLDPKYAKAWNDKGKALDDLGMYEEAIKAYDEAIRLNPNYNKAWINKGNALTHQGKYYEANKAYDEAIRINPNSVENLPYMKQDINGSTFLLLPSESPFHPFGVIPLNHPSYIARVSDRILEKLLSSHSLICVQGNYDIGKSSLLIRVPTMLPEEWRIIRPHLDLYEARSADTFEKSFFAELQELDTTLENWVSIDKFLQEFKLVFLIDGVNAFSDHVSKMFIQKLLALSERSPFDHIRVVMTLEDGIDPFLKRIGIRNPKYYHAWETISLAPFTHDELIMMINIFPMPVAHSLQDNLYTIQKYTAMKPSEIQRLCDGLWKHLRNKMIPLSEIDQQVKLYLEGYRRI